MSRRLRAAIVLWGVIGCAAPAIAGDAPAPAPARPGEPAAAEELDRSSVNRRLRTLFDRRDYDGARRLLEQAIASRPGDHLLRYNLACALAMLGKPEEAAESLTQAIARGFVDFSEMDRDPHLESIRSTSTYRAVLLGWGELLEERRQSDLQMMKEFFEGPYIFQQDDELRLQFASALDASSLEAARAEIRGVAAWWETHFGGVEPDLPADRPEPWVSVVIPTPTDFFRLIRAEGVGGIYDRTVKRLIAQDIGATLRHEFVHVLHWRQLARLGQEHPLWVMEGIAALVEDVEVGEDGRMVIVPSWRTNIVRRLEARNGLMKWEQFFRLDPQRFRSVRPRAMYAQARAVFMFMEARGVLGAWYRAYVDGFAADPSGVAAVEMVFRARVADVEKEFRQWVRTLPEVAESDKPGEAGLGVTLGPGAGDGLRVETSAAPGRGGTGEMRLRRLDVVEAVDDRPTRNLDDLHRVLGGYDVGDEVRVLVRRGTRRIEIPVVLVAPEAGRALP